MSEELKIVMDALVQLGEAGKAGFIWWLVIHYALNYVLHFAAACVALFVAYRVAGMMRDTSADYSTLKAIAIMMGAADKYGEYIRDELYEKIRALKEAAK